MTRKYSLRNPILSLFIILVSIISIPFFFYVFNNPEYFLGQEIDLPKPEFGSRSMSQALAEEYSWNQSFNSIDNPISIQDLSNVLWAAQGENRPGARVTPSAGATYPLDIYILSIINIEGYQPMLAKYSPSSHTLQPILLFNRSEDSAKYLPHEFHNKTNPVWIICSSIESRTSIRYGSRALQYITLEVGHVLENIRLTSWGRELKIKTLVNPQKTIEWGLLLGKEPKMEFFIGLTKNTGLLFSNRKSLISPKVIEDDNTLLNLSIEQTINLRSSQRDYLDKNITNTTVFNFLSLFSGLKNNQNQSNFPKFSTESPLNYYLFIGDKITGFSVGIYKLHINNGSIFLEKPENRMIDLQVAGLDQQWIGLASLNIVITSKTIASNTSRLGLLEAGVAGQRIYHVCTLSGLGNVVVGAFHDNLVQNLVESNGWPLYIIPIGPVERSLVTPKINSIPITIRTIGNLAGISAVFLLILMALFHTRIIRQYLKIKRQRIHYVFAGSIIGLISVHISFLNGYYQFKSGQISLIFDFLINLILFPPMSLELPESVGLWLSRMTVWVLLLLIFFMLPINLLAKRFSVKTRNFFHLSLFMSVISLALLHSYFNSNLLNLYFDVFLGIIFLGFLLWGVIHKYSSFLSEKKLREKNSN
jgi:SagB-type dehydrogenase family enzyme